MEMGRGKAQDGTFRVVRPVEGRGRGKFEVGVKGKFGGKTPCKEAGWEGKTS